MISRVFTCSNNVSSRAISMLLNEEGGIWYFQLRRMGRAPTIQGKKNATDAKRTALNYKLARELGVVSKATGGDRDNVRLAAVIAKAKSANMPKDKIDAAIKRGVEGRDGVTAENVLYEATGPGGSAFMIDTLTDNKKRTAPALRSILGKHGGALGTSGSVAWQFEQKGYLEVKLSPSIVIDDEMLMDLACEVGAEDVDYRPEINLAQFTCEKTDLAAVRTSLLENNMEVTIAELIYQPKDSLTLEGETLDEFQTLVEALDENEDVHAIHHNVNEL